MKSRTNLRRFSLERFPGEEDGPDIRITGSIGRRADLLSIRYALRGNRPELAIPTPEVNPGRRNRLWEETCLEFFLGIKGSGGYWEFNLSPAGHWNVYRFASYREEMREEPAFTSLPFHVGTEAEALTLTLELGIGTIVPPEKEIEAAVSAVIRTIGGETSHWALTHPGPRPDFHRRDGFTLLVPGAT